MALVPRMVLGKTDSGSGRRVVISLPGVDVLTADQSNPALMSLNSEWSAKSAVHQLSLLTLSGVGYVDATFPSLGYIPFVEARRKSGSVYYDDENVNYQPPASYVNAWNNRIMINNVTSSSARVNQSPNTSGYPGYLNPFYAVLIIWKNKAF